MGYRIRLESRISSKTRVEVVTEGILTRMLLDDPALEGVGTVIFDEFHERSLTSDEALALTRQCRSLLREDLRIVIMSATIDTDVLSLTLDAPVVESEGKMFPVEIVHSKEEADAFGCAALVAKTVLQAHRSYAGDILAFLPGEGEIRKAEELLIGQLGDTAIYPLSRKMLHILPPAELSGIRDIHERYQALSELIAGKNLVSFSGVPTWNILLMGMAMQKAGARTAEELWPHMEFFAHGGMSLRPYRKKLQEMFPSGKLRFIETYNASEGFFGVQTDFRDPEMTLMLDYENFYEFVPMTSYGRPEAKAVPVWGVEPGVEYALLVSTSSGLWRYDMGDVVRFTRTKPYQFVIVGRTHQNINIVGEDLSVQQAEKALEKACRQSRAAVREFTVAPDWAYQKRDGVKIRHEWLVEFEKEPENPEEFEKLLDKAVQEEDFDYKHALINQEASPLVVRKARPGLFYDWLDAKGKLGGQHKIPRLCPSRKYMDELLAMNSNFMR